MRTDAFRGFCGVVKNSQKLLDKDKQDAAYRLNIPCRQNRKLILKSSYLATSSAVYHLLHELRTKYASDIALLGFDSWLTEIEQADKLFVENYSQRIQESIDKPKNELRNIRLRINPLYSAIIDVVDICLLADGLAGDVVVEPEELDTAPHTGEQDDASHLRGNINYNFAIEWNEVIKKYCNMLAQRRGHRARKQRPEDPAD
jgi:hypothetical protein